MNPTTGLGTGAGAAATGGAAAGAVVVCELINEVSAAVTECSAAAGVDAIEARASVRAATFSILAILVVAVKN